MRKGVSPAVSYVLLLALVVIMSVAAYLWGTYEIQRLQDTPIAHNMESQMISVDQLIQSVSHGDINFTTRMNLYYAKGVMQVDAAHNWVKYTAQLNAEVYDRITETPNATCNSTTYVIQDSDTGIKMSRMPYTNVFRGGTGQGSQAIEMVACYDDVQIEESIICKGRSGPRAQLTARKLGYNGTSSKPIVEVKIC
ncbi:MAG: hypothetical protein KAW41_04700 [Candidatus Diapherotrites archaeon]|nr:hypothetical protein [Candidatus Diapherotrites archaeon]